MATRLIIPAKKESVKGNQRWEQVRDIMEAEIAVRTTPWNTKKNLQV